MVLCWCKYMPAPGHEPRPYLARDQLIYQSTHMIISYYCTECYTGICCVAIVLPKLLALKNPEPAVGRTSTEPDIAERRWQRGEEK